MTRPKRHSPSATGLLKTRDQSHLMGIGREQHFRRTPRRHHSSKLGRFEHAVTGLNGVYCGSRGNQHNM